MHMVIRCICYGMNKEEAFEKAKGVFEQLTENQQPFDYFTTFDDESSEVSGKGRWGEKPVIALASSKEGKKLIEEGFKFTKDGFIEDLNKIKDCLSKYSYEELFEGKVLNTKSKVVNKIEGKTDDFNLKLFKHFCYTAGQYKGNSCYLYDKFGEAIRDSEHLQGVLNKWGDKEYDGMKVYVVPADVHF